MGIRTPRLELEMVESCNMWVVETEPRSSEE